MDVYVIEKAGVPVVPSLAPSEDQAWSLASACTRLSGEKLRSLGYEAKRRVAVDQRILDAPKPACDETKRGLDATAPAPGATEPAKTDPNPEIADAVPVEVIGG